MGKCRIRNCRFVFERFGTNGESRRNRKTMRKPILFLAAFIFFGANLLPPAVRAQEKPLTLIQLRRAITTVKEKAGPEKSALLRKIAADVKARGVDFPLTPENEKLLRGEGATDDIIEIIRQNSPSVPGTKTGGKDLKNSIGMEFVRIPSGSFTMGGSELNKNEQPAHRVTISRAFYIGKYEVTIGEWKRVMGDSASPIADEDKMFYASERQPVIYVSWYDAQEYIKRLSALDGGAYRLPSEAEWEYAARAGTTTSWHFGNNSGKIDTYVWLAANSGSKTHKVGMKQPNGFGIYDIYGNVSEWVHDRYGFYQSEPSTDPFGPATGETRVIRGGGWNATHFGSTYRESATPNFRKNSIGFRLVRIE